MARSAVEYRREDDVAIIHMDDGKANALSPTLLDAISQALDQAEADGAGAVLLQGNARIFCAGFDLNVIRGGPGQVRAMLSAGGQLALRIYGFPRPVVMACTGHAIAMGAILLMAADYRIGHAGDYVIGLNEVANGMNLPCFAVELARARLSPLHLTLAVTQSRMYGPQDALACGYLDEVALPDELLALATERAAGLALLDNPFYYNTKMRERAALIDHLRAGLDADLDLLAASRIENGETS